MGVKEVWNVEFVIAIPTGTEPYIHVHRVENGSESDYQIGFAQGWTSQRTYQSKFASIKSNASVSQAAFDGVCDDSDAFQIDDARGLAWWSGLGSTQKSDLRSLINGSGNYGGRARIHRTDNSTNTLSDVCTKAEWDDCVSKADTETQENWEPYAETAFGSTFWDGLTAGQKSTYYAMFKAL